MSNLLVQSQIQAPAFNSTVTRSLTFTNTVAGNLLVVNMFAGHATTLSISDGVNTWNVATSVPNGTNIGSFYTWYAIAVGGTITITLTDNTAGSFTRAAWGGEWAVKSAVLDQAANSGLVTSATQPTPNATTTHANELVIGEIQANSTANSVNSVASSGANTLSGVVLEQSGFIYGFADALASSTGTYAMTFTLSTSVSSMTTIVTFQYTPPAATGGQIGAFEVGP